MPKYHTCSVFHCQNTTSVNCQPSQQTANLQYAEYALDSCDEKKKKKGKKTSRSQPLLLLSNPCSDGRRRRGSPEDRRRSSPEDRRRRCSLKADAAP
jgi:hypothetical protein